MSELVHISKFLDEWADQFDYLRGEKMSEAQKTQAEKIIDWADQMLELGHNSMWVRDNALYRLNQLGLNTWDHAEYRRRLNKITGVK